MFVSTGSGALAVREMRFNATQRTQRKRGENLRCRATQRLRLACVRGPKGGERRIAEDVYANPEGSCKPDMRIRRNLAVLGHDRTLKDAGW